MQGEGHPRQHGDSGSCIVDVNFVLHGASALMLLVCAGTLVWIARDQTRDARRFLYLIGLYLGTKALDFGVAEVYDEGGMADVVLDAINLVVAILLALSLYSGLRSMRQMTRVMESATQEYWRAHGDYDMLMQHRIRNPLTIIMSGAQTLLDYPDLPVSVRKTMLENMVLATRQLHEIPLCENAVTVEEQGLDGRLRRNAELN